MDEADEGQWKVRQSVCPQCRKVVIAIFNSKEGGESARIVQPKVSARAPISPHVEAQFAEDYREAATVLPDSQKASAALSRRCLQNLIREKEGIHRQSLSQEIDDVMPRLPSHLASAIDAIRHIGNFAAHPIKEKNTGEIVPVEPGEAEWCLDVLEQLFDHYFVQPAVLKDKRNALNKKLAAAGKPEMK